jgi:hypothetical protein
MNYEALADLFVDNDWTWADQGREYYPSAEQLQHVVENLHEYLSVRDDLGSAEVGRLLVNREGDLYVNFGGVDVCS